jgi:magnesium transporter
MNRVMKTLTTVSILMMFPTLIASIFGMNLINGMEENPLGFPFALIISVVVSAIAWYTLHRKELV